MRFSGKVVLVTGGARGIGREIVEQFAVKGASVIFTYKHSEQEASTLASTLSSQGFSCESTRLDVTKHEAVVQLVEEIITKYGKIDILINNAGVTADSFLMFMEEDSSDKVIDTNLKGTFSCSKAVIPCMLNQKSGVIINISSVAGHIGVSGQSNYCASKAGIIGFTKALSKELARKNIRVNSVAPGYIATEMLEQVPEKIRSGFKDKISCGKIGEALEVAKAVLFLASDDASYIHGHTLAVDGGMI